MTSCLEYTKKRKSILKELVLKFENKPCLAVVQIGNDNASQVYIRNKKKACEEIGVRFIGVSMKSDTSEEEVINVIRSLNELNNVHGIIVQLPLPSHINEKRVTEFITKEKDVDGFRNDSDFKPCTPKGIIDWLKYNDIEIAGKDVCIIGRSKIVGEPLVKIMNEEHATISWCNSKTKDIKKYTKNADIVICALGKANYFDASYFKEGQIVIDVGINRDDEGSLCGDICEDVSNIVKYKTPVPNGVGKLTVCSLVENTIEAYKLNGGT